MQVAIVPARSGSKRIPNKNSRDFAGKPIICYSIETALGAHVFDRVVVSTDSPEIATIAAKAGAEVPFLRPAPLADDYATTGEVMRHALENLSSAGSRIETACCIYPTAPLLQIDDLLLGMDKMRTGEWDYVFSAARYSVNIWRSFRIDSDGGVVMAFPQYSLVRTQDLPYAWYDAGQFYWGKYDAWVNLKPVFSERSTVIELPSSRVQDIDNPEDWARAEDIFRSLE